MSTSVEGRWLVPESWLWCYAKDIAKVIGGGTPSTKDETNFSSKGIPWLTPADLSDYNGIYIKAGRRDISEKGFHESSARLLPKGTVLFTSRAPIGYCVIAENPITTNQGFKSLVLESSIDPEYIRHYLLNSKEYAESLASGSTFKELSGRKTEKLKFPLPPLNEQRRIVAKIEELTAHSKRARAALDEVPTLIEQFKQSVLAAAFRGDLTADWREKNPDVEPAEKLLERIRAERRKCWEESELEKMRARGKKPKNEKWKEKYTEPSRLNSSGLPQLPKNWCWVSWEQVAINQNGRAFPSKEYSESGIKLLRPGNLHISGRVEWTKSNSRWMPEEWGMKYPDYIIQENELVINLTAQSLADAFLGRVCLTGHDEKCLLNQRIARLKPSIISPKFCLWLLKSPIFRKYVDTLNTGSMIQHMFTSQIDKFIFPLPPLEEQAEIIEIVESQIKRMEDICLIAEQAIEDFTSIGQSILAKAFRGELVSQDPNDEPAAVLIERIRAEREKLKAAKKGKKRSQRKKAKAP